MDKFRQLLQTNKIIQVLELIFIFLTAFILINLFVKEGEDYLIYNQAVIWTANIIMLVLVWLGLRLRGQGWSYFGLEIKKLDSRSILIGFLQSLLVFVIALAGFVLGSIVMANITGIPESSDMSGYAYLKDNIPMLLLTLFGVYIVSSFGEEVVYRGLLITRISELFSSPKTGRIAAVIISSVVFGFAHYSWGPMGVGQTAFMGLALALCYIFFKKKLWLLVVAHAYMDTILMVQMYLASN